MHRRARTLRGALTGLLFFATACGSAGSEGPLDSGASISPDGSTDAGTAIGDAATGEDGSSTPVDAGPAPSGLSVRFADGLAGCVATRLDPNYLNETLDRVARARFAPGWNVLPIAETTGPGALVEALEIGRGGAAASSTSGGVWTWTPGTNGKRQYAYREQFVASGTTWELVISAELAVEPGQSRSVVFDNDDLINAVFQAHISSGADSRWFGSCAFELYDCGVRQFAFEGGDSLKIETCRYCPPEWICKADHAGVKRAELRIGGEARNVADYFEAAMSMRHHNWGEDLAVLPKQAVGNVAGVFLGTMMYPDFETFEDVWYLDASLGVVETRTVTGVTTLPSW